MSFAIDWPRGVVTAGTAEGRWEPLRDVLGRVVGAQGGGGAALAVYQDGVPVVDLYAGEYSRSSVQQLYSVSKLVTAIVFAIVEKKGLVDLDRPLGAYWSAFDRPSTSGVTLRSVLSHRSGLSSFDEPIAWDDLITDGAERAIERVEPRWEPGTAHGYHAFSFGVLADGALKRTLGTTVGAFVAEHLAEPLGLDLWFGMPEAEIDRVSPMQFPPSASTAQAEIHAAKSTPDPAIVALVGDRENVNRADFLRASMPAGSGVAGARDMARLLASTMTQVEGKRTLDEAALDRMTRTTSKGLDRTLGVVSHFGAGVQLPFPQLPMLGPGSFGHEAAGGTVAVAHPESGLAIGFTTNVFPSAQGASVGAMSLLASVRLCAEDDFA